MLRVAGSLGGESSKSKSGSREENLVMGISVRIKISEGRIMRVK